MKNGSPLDRRAPAAAGPPPAAPPPPPAPDVVVERWAHICGHLQRIVALRRLWSHVGVSLRRFRALR